MHQNYKITVTLCMQTLHNLNLDDFNNILNLYILRQNSEIAIRVENLVLYPNQQNPVNLSLQLELIY